MEEAAVSVGTRPYWIHSMSEKKKTKQTTIVPTTEILGLFVIEG